MRRHLTSVCFAATAALVATTLSMTTSAGAVEAERPSDGRSRLLADSGGSATLPRSDRDVRFIGTAAGQAVENPAVSSSDSVREAARAHVQRYGDAVGAGRGGSSLVERRVIETVAGTDSVRYRQVIDGLPVVGGDVVVSMDSQRRLVSMLSTASSGARVKAPVVSEVDAEALAEHAVARGDDTAESESLGRWVLDPSVAGTTQGLGARTVWRFEVSQDVDRHEVFVDDRTGSVLMVMDDLHSANRVVCDNSNVQQPDTLSCDSGFARSEGGPASAVGDVNSAYDLAGATSDFYQALGVDLTSLIGIDTTNGKALASTVRWCYTGTSCPYANAFWDGTQMFYGDGWAGADDVVGHEMTHGVIDRTSELLYWGQSGAINESIADIFGEFIDHRTGGDDNSAWALGEDIPGFSPNGLRNMADPTLFGDPDSTQSPNWYRLIRDPACGFFYCDNGWVHLNSGVGNKTAYLIAKGGTFGGQTIAGIDANNETYLKSGRLWLLANQSLSSGSDYADLAAVLIQSCETLRAAGAAGMSAADCTNVRKATLATGLATRPPSDPQPADASFSCPAGHAGPQVLFDSETQNAAAKFVASGGWTRDESPTWGSNASSGQDSWHNSGPFNSNIQSPRTESMIMAAPVSVPTVNKTYLRFFHWDQLDFSADADGNQVDFFDGGTVEIDDAGDPAPPVDVAGLPWVNGPTRVLENPNPAAGRNAFSGDSYGWIASRVDLSSFAGRPVKAQFSVNYDDFASYIGWFVDDVVVYTCQPKVVAKKVKLLGKPVVGKKLKAKPKGWTAGTKFTYQWQRNGKKIKGAKGKKYKIKPKDRGKKLSVKVVGKKPGWVKAVKTSKKRKVKK